MARNKKTMVAGFTKSVFDSQLRDVVWVVVALLAVVPILVVVASVSLTLGEGVETLLTAQVLVLALFVALSIACGAGVLLWISSRLQDALATSSELVSATNPDADRDEWKGQNELTGLTQSLNRLQRELTGNLETLKTQARFLDRLERVLDYSIDMVLMMDRDGRVLFSNQAARQTLGILPDGVLDRALGESFLKAPDSEYLAGILQSWQDVDKEFQLERDDGEPCTIHCIQTVVESGGEESASKIVILRDVTEHSRMKRQLYRSEKLAALGQLISGVAHELNNPLTAILGFAEICRDPKLQKTELYENLEVIEHEALRSASVVENLLNFSRQRKSRQGAVNLRELLERCMTLLAYHFRTGNVSVERHYGDDVAELMLDEYQIQQVFMNLIINASQAMKEAETPNPIVRISTRIDRENRQAIVEISDNGPGIPEEIRDDIFSPFFTTKREDQGTGLGLTVSKNIVEDHNGTLDVQTQLGIGTTFVITFRMGGENDEEDRQFGEAQPAEQAEDASPQTAGGRVLVMDDETSILSMANQVLNSDSVQVDLVRTLSEAETLVAERSYDVVVADVHMPDGDGTDILDALSRTHGSKQYPYCVFITGNPRKAAELRKYYKEWPVLIKPFRLKDFRAAVMEGFEARSEFRQMARS